jgi:hypothetical protein
LSSIISHYFLVAIFLVLWYYIKVQGQEFVKALLALRAYRDAAPEGLNGMMAVCFVYRNRVEAGWWGGSWIEVLKHHTDVSFLTHNDETDIPDPRNYAFQCLLQEVDGIFNGTREDDISTPKTSILAVKLKPFYFAKLDQISNPWFLENIARNPEHKRMSQVGGLTLFS